MHSRELLHYWEIWYPKAGATGVLLARALIGPAESVLFHAPPDVITVEVSTEDGARLASGEDPGRTEPSPMCRLTLSGDKVAREDWWPTERDLNSIVILPGGEAGVLKSWWNAEDGREWRWQVEFYNVAR